MQVDDDLAAARLAIQREEFESAVAYLDRAEEALSGEEPDRRWIALQVARSWVNALTHRLESAARCARSAEREALRQGHADLRAEALLHLASVVRLTRDADSARAAYQEARAVAEACGAGSVRARCVLGDARVLRACGRWDEANVRFTEAAELAEAAGDLGSQAHALHDLGGTLGANRRVTEARAAYARARALFAEVGAAAGEASCMSGLGEIARSAGDLDAAEACYRDALAGLGGLHVLRVVAQLNLALVFAARGAWAEAREGLDEARRHAVVLRSTFHVLLVDAIGLPCHAALADWDAWDRAYPNALAILVRGHRADGDLAASARRAGELATEAGHLARAARAHALAHGHWARLGLHGEEPAEILSLLALRAAGAPIPLGPFDLVAEIGRGGMGRVWRAVHHATGTVVAVKVLTEAAARTEAARIALRSEVHAMATLDHPAVAVALDRGEVDAVAAGMSAGALVEGSPWFATELGDGTLERQCGRTAWEQARAVLGALLDGLAHAHARGVVHRDLKPANVLLAAGDVRIADFGLAHAVARVAGTPHYMAPEQFGVGEVGPWSDLYALGCVAVALVSGAPPFAAHGGDLEALRQAHLAAEPRIAPRVAVPSGFAPWARRLLEKAPEDRYACAADAARALAALGEPEAPGAHGPVAEEESLTWVASGPPRQRATAAYVVLPGVATDAPSPISWREPARERAAPRLAGAGLGLFALRRPRLVGRTAERERLWRALERVRTGSGPGLALIHGGPGTGRTRLARWLLERAEETGAAIPIAGSSPDPTALTHAPLRGADRDDVRVAAFAERLGVPPGDVVGLLAALGRRRPVVAWLDDVRDPEAQAGFAESVRASGARVLLVLSGGDTDDTPGWSAFADRFPGTERVEIGPLQPEECARLVSDRVGLDPILADRLQTRTGGNPLFLVQVLEEWAARGSLVPTRAGFRLREGTEDVLPDAQHAAWTTRMEGRLPAAALPALELAAALGPWVDRAEWEAACEVAGVPVPEGDLAALSVEGLVTIAGSGWSFAWRAFREWLLRRASEAGRLEGHHRVCVRVLESRAGPPDPGRLGGHLLAAGRARAACPPLLDALVSARTREEDLPSAALLDQCELALAITGAPPDDPSWGRLLTERALLLEFRGAYAESAEVAEDAVARARRHGWREVLPEALRALAKARRGARDVEGARRAFEEARERFASLGDAAAAARCRLGLGILAHQEGRSADAAQVFSAALDDLGEGGPPELRARILNALGSSLALTGRATEAEEAWAATVACARGVREHRVAASASVGLADLQRRQGRLDEAEAHCRDALAVYRAMGARYTLVPRVNLALVRIARDDFDLLDAELAEIREDAIAHERDDVAACIEVYRLVGAVTGADEPWRRRLEAARAATGRTPLRDPDLAWCLERAARRAPDEGRAEACRALAAELELKSG